MERKQYLDQIKELVQTVQTLLDTNIALGNKQKEQKAESDRKIASLQEQVDKLTGELQSRRRKMHGKNNGRISSEDSLTWLLAERRDYALKTEALLVKSVYKSEKSNFLKYSVSLVNTGDGVVLS